MGRIWKANSGGTLLGPVVLAKGRPQSSFNGVLGLPLNYF